MPFTEFESERLERHPLALNVIDRGERIAICLLAAPVFPHRLRFAVFGERPISARRFGDATDPIATVPLRRELRDGQGYVSYIRRGAGGW